MNDFSIKEKYMKSYKVRIFYNGYYDTYIDAPSEDHVRDIIESVALDHSEDVKLSYDFAEIDEIGGV
jgi:hypothetical protein